jgi:hypothetical protein
MNLGYQIRIAAFTIIALSAVPAMQAVSAQADNGKLNVYRCTDSAGKVSLQDRPCADSGKQQVLEMTRPVDAKTPDVAIREKPKTIIVQTTQAPQALIPPPDLFRCTDFDGNVRDSEMFDRNPRCVPLWVLGFNTRSNACSWVEDSCVRYEGRELCNRWRERLRQAELDLRHSPSSRTPFLRSEVARIEQIVRSSCR